MDKRMWTDGFARRRDAQKKDRQTSRSLDKQMTNKWKQRGGQQWLTNSFNMIQQNPDRNIYIYKRDEAKQSGCVLLRCSTNKTALTGQDNDGWIVTLTLLINYWWLGWWLDALNTCVCVRAQCVKIWQLPICGFFSDAVDVSKCQGTGSDFESPRWWRYNAVGSAHRCGLGLMEDWTFPSHTFANAKQCTDYATRICKALAKRSHTLDRHPAKTCSVHDIVPTWLQYSSNCIQETQQQVRQTETCLRSKISLVKGYPSISSPPSGAVLTFEFA